MFIFYTAKIRQINDTTKYFTLNNVNRIDLFSILYIKVKISCSRWMTAVS